MIEKLLNNRFYILYFFPLVLGSLTVLSFPFYNKKDLVNELKRNKEVYLGDIILNLNKIDDKNKNFKNNFNKLWIHGLVHLFGYKHKKDKDFYHMRKIEKKFVSFLK